MTSGPMRAGALPPDRQPDPQVVAWMRGHLREHPGTTKVRLISAWLAAHGHDSFTASGRTLPELTAAAKAACSPKPLTVEDIPAGQGPASLYVDGASGAVMYRAADGRSMFAATGLDPSTDDWPALHAVWEHLAATLPTIDTEDVDLTPLFDTPQIHTDTDGRHWDDTGREHRAVDIDGEITYQPTVDTTEEST